jgi:hypothetical protein
MSSKQVLGITVFVVYETLILATRSKGKKRAAPSELGKSRSNSRENPPEGSGETLDEEPFAKKGN